MSFKDILGQSPAIKIIRHLLKSHRVAGAYLFTGPEGVGKKTMAMAMAGTLNCQKKELEACGECPSCQAFNRGIMGEVIVLIPEGAGLSHQIDTIRRVQSFVGLVSWSDVWKVIIMDEAEKMTEEAASAFLKILEEPPSKTLFILVSSRPENIFKTVLSRCQVIKFLPLSTSDQRQIIRRHFDGKIREEMLAVSSGGVGKTLALLTPGRESWRKELLDIQAEKIKLSDPFSLSQRLDSMAREDKRDGLISDTLHLLYSWYRDLLLAKEKIGPLLNSDYAGELTKLSEKFSASVIFSHLQAINEAERDHFYQVNTRLILDTLFVTLCTK